MIKLNGIEGQGKEGMNDNQKRRAVLQKYYDRRDTKRPVALIADDFSDPIPNDEISRITEALSTKGLVYWWPELVQRGSQSTGVTSLKEKKTFH